MFIRVGGSLENPGGILSVGGFKPSETKNVTDKVIRCLDNRGNIPEIRYQTNDGNAYISGYSVSPDKFHISFIVNKKRKKKQFLNLAEVFHTTLQDLEHTGIKEVTVNCIPKLVPIAMKRYGFQAYDGKPLEDVMKKTKGFLVTSLVKKF